MNTGMTGAQGKETETHDTVESQSRTEQKQSPERVELFVRASAPMGDQVDEIVNCLERLETEGSISEFKVRELPKQVNLGNRLDFHSEVVDMFEEFEEWAQNNGVSLRPFFSRNEYRSSLANERGEIVSFPVLCMSVYEDEELTGVYPCSNTTEKYTVHDCIEELTRA